MIIISIKFYNAGQQSDALLDIRFYPIETLVKFNGLIKMLGKIWEFPLKSIWQL